MPKISINILTKNRAELLKKALASVSRQSFKDFQVEVISDGSMDRSVEEEIDRELRDAGLNINFVFHNQSLGITASREEALKRSQGEYIAVLDDDDEWIDVDKLKKQVEYLDNHKDVVLVGGGIKIELGIRNYKLRMRPELDSNIRRTMLLRNNFFTSTVMFRRDAAIRAGGFVKDQIDLAEDYDLWLRLGLLGKMANFREVFTAYRLPSYNKDKFRLFLQKQLMLINKHKQDYPGYFFASLIIKLRLWF